MPYVTPESILQAKKMDLLTYLQKYEPKELIYISNDTYSTKSHDSLKISNGKWCWFSRGIGGRSALDYLVKVKGMSFVKAVETITGQAAVTSSALSRREMNAQNRKKVKILLLPERNADNEQVKKYLSGRGIHNQIIDYCVENKFVYEDKDYNNAVFVGYDLQGVPRSAVLRGISGVRFLRDVLGSDKHFSFSIPPKIQSPLLHIFESAIDLLSYSTLEFLGGRPWRDENLMSLSGVFMPRQDGTPMNTPIALSRYLKDRPHIKTINLHLDNDFTGKTATKALILSLSGDYSVIDEPPKSGKDINDQLVNYLSLLASGKERER
jgi:hypothetical protein